MGAAGVLHGVSGGSMALLLGIYHEFIFSIRAIDCQALSMLREKKMLAFWKKINGGFLTALLAGLAVGLLVLRGVLKEYYQQFPIFFSSFFFSLIILAALLLFRKITRWNPGIALCAIAGLLLSYSITRAAPMPLPDNAYLSGFITGIASGSTFAIPGVSGAFILIFFGKYQHILASFGSLESDIITLFVAGGILGLFIFARLIAAMLAKYFNPTVAFFAGLMIGSLNKIWPWRQVFEYTTNMQGKRIPAFDQSILPWRYLELTGKDPQVFYAILMMASGIFMVVLIEKITARFKTKS